MKTDPTDTGGLFISRRPGTRPVKYRALPKGGSERRQRLDNLVARTIRGGMIVINLCFWGPIPAAWLWVGGHIQGATNNVGLAILVAFLGMMFTLLGALIVLRWLDQSWILVRRAAGHDQRSGTLGGIFALTAAIGAVIFTVWLLVFAGLGPTLAPNS